MSNFDLDFRTLRMTVTNPRCQVCGTFCSHSRGHRGHRLDDQDVKCMKEIIGLVKTAPGHFETSCGTFEVCKRPGKASWYFRKVYGERSRSFPTAKEAIKHLFMTHGFALEGTTWHTIARMRGLV